MKDISFSKKVFVWMLHLAATMCTTGALFTMDYFLRQGFSGGIVCGVFALIGCVGSAITFGLMTIYAKPDDYVFDRFFAEILILLQLLATVGLVRLGFKMYISEFSLPGILIAIGTITLLIDLSFVIVYTSILRRIKAKILYDTFAIGRLIKHFKDKKKTETSNVVHKRSHEQDLLYQAIVELAEGKTDVVLNLSDFEGQEKDFAEAINNVGAGINRIVEHSIRNERMKADLITNVSHDIKTPLTSIINYIDLLKRENLEKERAKDYLRILDTKSLRLKQLIDDLVEASKISSGNIHLEINTIDFVELIYQIGGEFNERFEARNLTIVTKIPNKSIYIDADGRQLYRTIENLYINASKYALENTTVYVELREEGNRVNFEIKNISNNPLKEVLPEGGNELTERFVRGETSRTTEGSGLGLSIASNLTKLMGGEFQIRAEGELFIARISFKMA